MDRSYHSGEPSIQAEKDPDREKTAVAPAQDAIPSKKDRAFLVDVKQADTEVVIYADLPGIDEDDIDIAVRDNVLRIAGEREFNHDAEDSEEYVQLERPYGRFVRDIPLVGKLDEDRVTAKYHRGVLKVRIPKMRTR